MFLVGISLLSAATLLLEVLLTRVLSVTQGYHFAFLIVSTALLGTGSAGAYLALHLKWRPVEPSRWVVIAPLLFGPTTCLSYILLNGIPFDVVKMAWDYRQMGWFLLAYLILAVPFFFSGLTIATAFLIREVPVGKVYFADLSGAAAGAILPLGLFLVADGPGIVVAAAALGTLGGLLIWGYLRPVAMILRAGTVCILALAAIAAYFVHPSIYELNLSPYRGLRAALLSPEARLVQTRWNAVSRVDVVESPLARFAPGLSLTYRGRLPRQLGLAVDGGRLDAITAFDGSHGGLEFLEYLPAAAPFFLGRPAAVFVANPGGGMDVLMALYFGAGSITVAERNPLMPAVISESREDFQSRIYRDPRVDVAIGHERSILQSTPDLYDLIVLPGIRGVGSGGPIGLVEDFTFTVEAFGDYYRRLSQGGWLSISRYLEPQPVYAVRLLATAIEALEGRGVEHPGRHLAVLRSWGTITLLIKRGEISRPEIEALRRFSDSRRFDLVHYPGMRAEEANRYNRFPGPIYYDLVLRLLDADGRHDLYRTYPFRIRPATDDRPFFSYVLRWDRIGQIYVLVREKWMFLVEGGLLVPVMLAQAAGVAALLILLPTWLRVRSGVPEARWARGRVFLYFFCIALGFMWIEMAMIQRLILYLVHPVYAISIVLSSLLLFAGIGSRISADNKLLEIKWRTPILSVLCLLILAEALLLPWLSGNTLALPMLARFALTVCALAPAGILMGMPFPLGMQRLKRSGLDAPLAWAWAINGSTSVVAVILSILLSLGVGISGVFALAAAAYGVAAGAAVGRWYPGEGTETGG